MPTGSQSINGQPGRYNLSLPTLNDGQGAALAIDANGKLLISGSVGSSTVDGSTFTAGSTTGALSFGSYQTSPTTLSNNQSAAIGIDVNRNTKVVGTKTNNNAAPGANNIGVLSSLANAAVQTWTEGDLVLQSVDLSGNNRATLGTLIAGEDLTNNVLKVEERFSYARIATATTTLVKSGAGFLHAIIVNTPVGSGVIEVDDALTNTTPIVAKITYPASLISDGPVSVTYDVSFATGLSITTTGTMDITVVYR